MATTTWVNDLFASLIVRSSDAERQDPARSQSTSIPIDVRISVYPMGENHPLVSTFGAFADEPFWDEFVDAMNEYRQEEVKNQD